MDMTQKIDRIFSLISRFQDKINARPHLYFYFKTVDVCLDNITILLLKHSFDKVIINTIYDYIESVSDILNTPNFEVDLIGTSSLEYISNEMLSKIRKHRRKMKDDLQKLL